MKYRKDTDKFKEIYKQGGVLTHSITGKVYTPNELRIQTENNIVINKKGFNKVFKLFSREMNYDPKDYGYCMMRINYGLDKDNALSNEYLDKLKKEMTENGLFLLLKRLIEKKMIARTGRGKYTLNPNIAQYGTTIDKKIYELFE